MVDVAGIDSEEALQAWLKGRSREDVICIEHRVAMRAAPLFWSRLGEDWARKGELTALTVMWPLLTSGVARKYPAHEVRSADASFAATVAYTTARWHHADYRSGYDTDADPRSWRSVRMDCAELEAGRDPFAFPLWEGTVPDKIAKAWEWTRADWAEAGGSVWLVWTQFYENALLGRPQDWPLLHDIALIPAEDWQGGPDRVHPIIEGMLLERAVKATPNAERITLNPETGKLRVETISSLPPKYLHDAVDSLRDAAAIFDAKGGGNNSYALILPDVALLRNGLDRYGTRPNMLVVTCRRVVQRVETKVASGDCPRNDALVEDFLGEVARVISDLLIFDPEVREAASARAAFRLGEVSPQDAKTVERAADEVALASEGVLSDEVPKDARMVSDPTRSEAERHEALFETASRFFRVQTLVKGYKAVRPAIKEAADVSKEMAIIAGTWTGLPAAVAFLLKLFL